MSCLFQSLSIETVLFTVLLFAFCREVDDILDRIHSNALHQRDVLDYHNQDLLPRLQQKTGKTDDDVTKMNKRIGKQLR